MKSLRSQKGFTLIELLFVAVVLALLSSILYGTLRGITRSKDAVDGQGTAYTTGRYVIGRLSQELQGRVSEPLIFFRDSQPKGSKGSGRRRYLLGINEKNGEAPSDSLHFVSSTAAQAVFAGKGNFGRVQLRYKLEDDPDATTTEDGTKTFLLVREELPAGVRDEATVKARRVVFPIAKNVVGLNFRYYFQEKWNDQWSGVQRRFPEAIEITLKLRGAQEQVEIFKTAVAISKRPKRRSSRSTTDSDAPA